MSQKYYEPEFKKKIIRLRLEEGRTIPSICKEYGLARSTVSTWCKQFTEDCQNKATTSPDQTTDLDLMKENLRLHKELEEMKKEVLFLKKQRHSSRRRSIDGLSVYSKIRRLFWSQMAP